MQPAYFKRSEDLFFILTLLKKEKILNFEKKVPYFLIGIIYEFLWKLLYKAKVLSKYKEKKGIDIIDIKIALILIAKTNNSFEMDIANLKHIVNIVNKQKLPKKTNNSVFKITILTKFLLNDEHKIFGSISR